MSVKEGCPVQFLLRTTVNQDDREETFLYEGMGKIVALGEWYYLRYMEEKTQISVTIKFSREGKVTIMRRSEKGSRLSFDSRRSGTASIGTPMGMMEAETVTSGLKMHFKDAPFAGSVELGYALLVNDQLLGNYQMELQFTT